LVEELIVKIPNSKFQIPNYKLQITNFKFQITNNKAGELIG
jgi:hypothetical protein